MKDVCIKCGKDATSFLTVDLDIKGIAVCDEHKIEVRADLVLAMMDKNYEHFEKKYYGKKQK
jgi:hypothetical protein